MTNALIVESTDNVVVAIEAITKGTVIVYKDGDKTYEFTAVDDVPIYHKIAKCDIARGENVIKYNEPIGAAARDIRQGEHVHCHNVADFNRG